MHRMRKHISRTLFIFMAAILCCAAISMQVFAFPPSSKPLYHGIDVSYYQGSIDFAKVKQAGIQVVYIRSSQGDSYVDPYFRQNYDRAKAQGLKVGFYHYVTARTVQQAKDQAAHFVSTIAGTQPDCRLAMDFEALSGLTNQQINNISMAFLQEVERLSGKEVVLYTNVNVSQNILSPELAQYPIWIASYFVEEPEGNGKWDSWVGFQYSDAGQIPGIRARVDLDYFTDGVFLDSVTPPLIPPGYLSYTVQSGDTLWKIANQYDTTVTQLSNLNGIANPNLIYPGQVIKIPISGNSGGSSTTYVVKSGDTLSEIAQRYGVTTAQLSQWNHISNPNLIYPGQVLQLSSSGSENSTIYIVKSGDTLWEIAQKYNTTTAKLAAENALANPNLIYPGQRLTIS